MGHYTSEAAAPWMEVSCTCSCRSLDRCGLHMQLLLIGWVHIVCCCHSSDMVDLLVCLLLLKCGWAACRAAVPWMGAGCSDSCLFIGQVLLRQGRLHEVAAPLLCVGYLCWCCSLKGHAVHMVASLRTGEWATHISTAFWMEQAM